MQCCKMRCSPGSADAVLQNEMQSRKCGCSAAKRDAVQEVRMQCCKTRCSPGSADAVLQNEMQSRKCGCSAAKADAVQEVPMQHCKMRCSPGNGFAALQSHFLYSILSCGRDRNSLLCPAYDSKNSGAFGRARGIGILPQRRRSQYRAGGT